MPDTALRLREVAAVTVAHRKLMVLLTNLVLTGERLTREQLQTWLLQEGKAQLDPSLPDPAFGALVASEMEELADMFEPADPQATGTRDAAG